MKSATGHIEWAEAEITRHVCSGFKDFDVILRGILEDFVGKIQEDDAYWYEVILPAFGMVRRPSPGVPVERMLGFQPGDAGAIPVRETQRAVVPVVMPPAPQAGDPGANPGSAITENEHVAGGGEASNHPGSPAVATPAAPQQQSVPGASDSEDGSTGFPLLGPSKAKVSMPSAADPPPFSLAPSETEGGVCPTCHGRGYIKGWSVTWSGPGYDEDCDECNGTGRVRKTEGGE